MDNLGTAYHALGQVERAIKYYEEALTIAREIGFRQNQAILLHQIGKLYVDQAKFVLARQYLAQAIAIFEEIKSPQAFWV